MQDHTFEEPEEERERLAVDAGSELSVYEHARGDDRLEPNSDPLFTTLRTTRKQAGDFRPVLSDPAPGVPSAPGVDRNITEEAA